MQSFFEPDTIRKINNNTDYKKKLLKDFSYHQLYDIILPYWIDKAPDNQNDGFAGEISGENVPDYDAVKGLILNSRILWTFSSVYLLKDDNVFYEMANRAYNYLVNYFKDNEHQGYYWSLDKSGNPVNRKKQVYGQAFMIYALSEYYKINRDESVINEAVNLFDLIEKHAYDKEYGGYLEAFTREWVVIDDARLSPIDMNEQKTMNSHLHILEAYTNLYRVWPDQKLKTQLYHLIDVFRKHFINPDDYHLHLFFDEKWNLKSNSVSYGHDIETSWLLYEAVEALNDKDLMKEVADIAVNIAKAVLKGNNSIGGMIYEKERGKDGGKGMEWWNESEAVIGFYNAYQLTGEKYFLDNTLDKAVFIDRYYSDYKDGEWHNRLHEDGTPVKGKPKAGFWKCPYHNVRMCLELIKRIEHNNNI